MSSKKLLLIGGGGHCKSVLDSLYQTGEYAEIGIIDKKINVGEVVLDSIVIGCDDDLISLHQEGYNYAFVTLGSVGNPSHRIKLFMDLEDIGFEIPNIIDLTAIVSKYTVLETGIYIGKNVVINADTHIGKGAIINTSVTIEHDCFIDQFSHIAPGTVLCGGVKIGKGTHAGANSVIKQEVKIGDNSMIGMGSVVLHDVDENSEVYGNPGRNTRN